MLSVKNEKLSVFNTVWSLVLAVLNIFIYSQDKKGIIMVLFLVFVFVFLFKQAYYFIRLAYIVIRYAPNKAPDPPDDYKETLQLDLGWFSPVSIILLLIAYLISFNWYALLILLVTIALNIYIFYSSIKE
ncbi:conserved membrane hypothetical protein [Oenococcus oeni]|nr:conserved membrane hypothetical protein [Oenococcus oeni]